MRITAERQYTQITTEWQYTQITVEFAISASNDGIATGICAYRRGGKKSSEGVNNNDAGRAERSGTAQ